jgi:hypothetical protein
MPIKNLSKQLTCPVCRVNKKWGEMVKHIAYSGDPAHEKWRVEHKLPKDIVFGHLNEFEPSIRLAVVKEFSQ